MTIVHRRAVAQRGARRSPIAPCSSRRDGSASKAPPQELAARDDLARAVFLGPRGRLTRCSPTLVTRQLVFDGFVSGLVFGLLALGIVLVYRATRVINFAVGNMGLDRRRAASRC